MQQPDLSGAVRIHYVRLTNNGKIPFTDRHDGVPVRVEPGKSENFPLDMAQHFFGFYQDVPNEVMFRHVCKRQGWNTPADIKPGENGKTPAQEKFDALEIKPVAYRMVEVAPDTDAPIPADPQPPAEELPPLPARKQRGA